MVFCGSLAVNDDTFVSILRGPSARRRMPPALRVIVCSPRSQALPSAAIARAQLQSDFFNGLLAGKPKRPAIKRDGKPQSEGSIKYRYVHLVLAVTTQRGWSIEPSGEL